MRIFLAILALFISVTVGAADADNSSRPTVTVLTSSFVLPAKFQAMGSIAEAADVDLISVNIEDEQQLQKVSFAKTGLIVLDVPRPSDRQKAERTLADKSRDLSIPYLVLGGGTLSFSGLSSQQAKLLSAYYMTGGRDNFQHFFEYVRNWKQNGDLSGFSPPEPVKKAGFYHTAADGFFGSFDDYLKWGGTRWKVDAGRIGFIIRPSAVTNMETGVLDALIRQSEAKGLMPVIFWFDNDDPEGLVKIARSARFDALVNLTHLMNGTARKKDFAELDIPVIQTLGFREGNISDWVQAPSGIPARTAAVFLAGPEGWGMSDPIVLTAVENGAEVPIPAQLNALIGKLDRLVALRRKPEAQKHIALLFWNYPAGEKNMAASNLNLPGSIESISFALKDAGYNVSPVSEQSMIEAGQAMLGALYRTVSPEELLSRDLADVLPVADYEGWLRSLPEERRKSYGDWGEPSRHWSVRNVKGVESFVIPRMKLGNLIIMPQMPRADTVGAHYHDLGSPPDHLYMAAYLYLRQTVGVDAIIHMGTHGTQEWLPGKDRGLSAMDDPFLAVGDVPVFYPYIQDNVGEALQARRRGRAITISHQTPPFAPSGLYDELRDIHHLIHEFIQLDEGAVRDETAKAIADKVIQASMNEDLGWSADDIRTRFDEFLPLLHDHLHELSRTAMPLGLHRFGVAADPDQRLVTIMQQLGAPFDEAIAEQEHQHQHGHGHRHQHGADDPSKLKETAAYKTLHTYLREGADRSELSASLKALLDRADKLEARLAAPGEMEALLAGLDGRFLRPGLGGDPIRNPDTESGRNIYAFEADRIPTRAAFEAGSEAFDQLLASFRKDHDGALPKKLAFSLWSSEAIRHMGITEAQILHALGLRPIWDESGRVSALEIVPASELDHPRIDVVIQVTSVYRDQFDSFMRLLADAIDRLADLDEPGNRIALNSASIAGILSNKGVKADLAVQQSRLRIFSAAPGNYGTGLPDLTLKSTSWDDEKTLAEQFLGSMRFAYGSKQWGVTSSSGNLFAAQLKGAEAAIMSRSSNLHGVLSTDHPFEFLGGLSLAIRTLDGKSPALYISDLRNQQPLTTSLSTFLSNELRVRYLNPHWIEGMKGEGYAGTLAMLNSANNLFGWQVVDPSTVRADQWQAMFDVYVADKSNLGLNAFFEQYNPTAQAQLVERMIEAIRKGYWDAPDETRRQLVKRWHELVADHGVNVGEAPTREFVNQMALGFGLAEAASNPSENADTMQQALNVPQPVKGQELEQVTQEAEADKKLEMLISLLVLHVLILGGAFLQWRSNATRNQLR